MLQAVVPTTAKQTGLLVTCHWFRFPGSLFPVSSKSAIRNQCVGWGDSPTLSCAYYDDPVKVGLDFVSPQPTNSLNAVGRETHRAKYGFRVTGRRSDDR